MGRRADRRVPTDDNQVGSYRRDFQLPDGWQGRQVFLHFDGVQSASYVWVNGQPVGYNEGGMEPAEYNVTKYLRPGHNTLAVQVLQYSTGSYLEDQDMWRFAGIFRDVYLFSAPPVHIRAYSVVTALGDDGREARMTVTVEVTNYSVRDRGNYEVELRLADVTREPLRTGVRPGPNATAIARLELEVPNPKLWSAEQPNLYRMVLGLRNSAGEPVEFVSSRIGFREVELRDGQIKMNGVAATRSRISDSRHSSRRVTVFMSDTLSDKSVLVKSTFAVE
jgi:beta-galactosidase